MKNYLFKVKAFSLLGFAVMLLTLSFNPSASADEAIIGRDSVDSKGHPISSGSNIPIARYGRNIEYLYPANELMEYGLEIGDINSIAIYLVDTSIPDPNTWGGAWNFRTTTNREILGNLRIQIANVPDTMEWYWSEKRDTRFEPDSIYTEVYSINNFVITEPKGWITFNFSQPFRYTGGSLVVRFCLHNTLPAVDGNGVNNNYTYYFRGTSAPRVPNCTGNNSTCADIRSLYITGTTTGGGSNIHTMSEDCLTRDGYPSSSRDDYVSHSASIDLKIDYTPYAPPTGLRTLEIYRGTGAASGSIIVVPPAARNSLTDILYLADSMSAVGAERGFIRSIGLYLNSGSFPNRSLGKFRIFLANSDRTDRFNTNEIFDSLGSFTEVFEIENLFIAQTAGNWVTFELPRPFLYTGQSLIVRYCQSDVPSLTPSGGDPFWRANNNLNGNPTTGYLVKTDNTTNSIPNSCQSQLVNGASLYVITAPPTMRIELDIAPLLEEVHPSDVSFSTNYGSQVGDITTPFVSIYKAPTSPQIQISYKILSPLGDTVFETYDRNTSSNWIDIDPTLSSLGGIPFQLSFRSNQVRGSRADVTNPDVSARLSFRADDVTGGTYEVIVELRYKDDVDGNVFSSERRNFNVLYPYDIQLTSIISPISNELYPMLAGESLKFSSRIINAGQNEIRNFNIHYYLLRAGNTTDTIWQQTYNISLPVYLEFNDDYTHETSEFMPAASGVAIGSYRLYASVELVGHDEYQTADNMAFVDFDLTSIYDGQLVRANVRGNTYTNQPVYPRVEVDNLGGFGVAVVPIKVTIKDNTGAEVYEATEYIQRIPSRELTTYEFNTPFFPATSGNYTLEAELSTNDDYNVNNNSGTANFTVSSSLTGIKTIGSSGNYDYATITSAISDVYRMGVQDTVTFVFYDSVMTLGTAGLPYALDFSSSIAGFNENKLIRFVPSEQLSARQGSIRIATRSTTGIGFRFASSTTSQFANAPINVIKTDSRSLPFGHSKMDYYPFNARVEFDGGSNKSIQFETGAAVGGASNRILVFIGEGAQNIAFRNCIFKSESIANSTIPTVSYNVGLNRFTFSNIENVSTSILLRNVPPAAGTNIRLDSSAVLINNINIENNIFTTGAYGIISIGIGPQYNNDSGNFITYYNCNNNFVGNQFADLDNAAIFLGYETNSLVSSNRINRIGQSRTGDYDNAGIILGGFGTANTSDVNGYNNLNITVSANEISNVTSSKDAYGIKVEQERNNFSYLQTIIQRYIPDGNDSLRIFNNVIWGLRTNTDASSRYGIRLFSARQFNAPNAFSAFAEPRDNNYYISHSQIINNSVFIEDDGRTGGASAYIGGIVAQNVTNFQHFNNAIAILDNTTNANADVVAPFVLQSVRPNAINRIESNNNIYYNANSDDVLIRFIESSPYDGSIRDAGFRGQYVGLDQWQYWNKSDMSSAENNFTTGLETINVNTIVLGSVPSLRVKAPAATGYYLFNRGRIVPAITTDIFGNPRGQNDRAYNVGAWEFTGNLYQNDIEIAGFITPGSYKDLSDEYFRLAEYVMTTTPIDVAVYVKNNGNKRMENVLVTLKVFRENALVKEYTKRVSISIAEVVAVSFADEIKGEDFPKTYAELNLTPPSYLASMGNNVTPIYRFDVSIPSDQDLTNNLKSKDVRFFIKKSKVNTLLSVANTDFVDYSFTGDYMQHIANDKVITTEADFADVAGYLNYRALYDGMIGLGYRHDTSGFDLFDRKNWERNSVNYTPYLTMFWADGLDNTLTDEQETDVNDFINRTSTRYKHNLIFASEELARNSTDKFNRNLSQADFVRLWFATTRLGNGIWEGTREADGSILLTGARINLNVRTSIRNTLLVDFGKDRSFKAGIFGNYNSTVRTAAQAFFYTKPETESQLNKTFGVASNSIYDNMFYFGADWRNFANVGTILGGILNFIGGLEEIDFVLSAELLDFNAYLLNNKVQLVWETSNEHTTSKFVVEKAATSGAGVAFNPINEVQANRNSSISNSYSAVDADIFAGNTYIYRLKSIDVSGNATYSNEKMINVDANNNLISLDKPHPNPASNDIIINFNLSTEMDIRLSIFDINGNEVVVVREGMFSPKTHKFNFSIANLASGTYNLVLRANGNIIAQQFNIVK